MKLIPNFLETNTAPGDHTVLRKRYLTSQIKALQDQQREVSNLNPDDLFHTVSFARFSELLQGFINKFKLELSEYYDKQDEYNS